MYEELLRGSAEIYGSAFASKAKKAIETLSEERKRKVSEKVIQQEVEIS